MIALHSYQDKHGRLPPAVVYGADGRPLHSWRVLLLPYISEEDLFKKFKLDEPWDSPHNLALLPYMPRTYEAPYDHAGQVGKYETVCHVFVGRGAAFEGPTGLRLKEDFPDGLGSTIMVFEGGPPVPWTKPEEIRYDPDEPLPELYGIFQDGYRVLLGDGSSRWIPRGSSEATWRALITRNAGDKVGAEWLR